MKTFVAQDVFAGWTGEYCMLCKPPASYEKKLRLGGRGPIVEWVDRHLALAQHRKMTGKKDYDRELQAYVKTFQKSVSLNPEGTVGPLTIAFLQGMVVNDPPVLSNGKGSL